MDKFKIAVTGALSPVGAELVKILLGHPMCELFAVSSVGATGKTLGEFLPEFRGRYDKPLISESELIVSSDIVFNADPALDSQELAAACISGRSVLIDLGSDLRFSAPDDFALWHGGQYLYPALHEASLYCIPELTRDRLPGKVLISCPGAIAAAAVLLLAPLLDNGLIYPENIVINACVPSDICSERIHTSESFRSAHNSIHPYSVGDHICAGEIESYIFGLTGQRTPVTLLPVSVPLDRGMSVTCCVATQPSGNEQNIRAAYEKAYASEQFIHLMPRGSVCSTAYTIGTNFCDISVARIERTGTVAVTAAMDIFIKGSAGNAVQIMNALLNIPEGIGLGGTY